MKGSLRAGSGRRNTRACRVPAWGCKISWAVQSPRWSSYRQGGPLTAKGRFGPCEGTFSLLAQLERACIRFKFHARPMSVHSPLTRNHQIPWGQAAVVAWFRGGIHRFHDQKTRYPSRYISLDSTDFGTPPSASSGRKEDPDRRKWKSSTTIEREAHHARAHPSRRDAARGPRCARHERVRARWAHRGAGEPHHRDPQRPATQRCGSVGSSAPRASSGSTYRSSTNCGSRSGRTGRRYAGRPAAGTAWPCAPPFAGPQVARTSRRWLY